MVYNPLQSLNVLVIEDQDVAQLMVQRVLKTIGVENLTVASNGVEGIDALTNAEPMIDLVICDINMPEMGGYEFVRRVRLGAVPGSEDLPVLILTGDESDANVQNAKIHKFHSFIVKPADADTLRNQMLHALGLQPLSEDGADGGAVKQF
jgi:two-component system, chemotaxis family, chemotaxis protein CheY